MNLKNELTEEFLYRRLAQKIAEQIETGVFRVGERLSSIRKMSGQERVSLSTVMQAYQLLESRELIEARPQSGFYVRFRRENLLPEPKTSSPSKKLIKTKVGNLLAKGHSAMLGGDYVAFGAALPDPKILPIAKLNSLATALSRRFAHATNTYSLPPGNVELRRQIAKRSLDWGGRLMIDDIVTTSGTTEAMSLCLRAVTKFGDTIAVESPTYFGLLQLAESLGLNIVEIPMNPRYGMCLDSLENLLNRYKIAACVGVLNFNNPLGSLMPDENKKRLVTMLEERDIPLIENDIYGDLYFGSGRPINAKSFETKGLVMLCSSVSKSLAPGYRVGWTAAGKFKEVVEQTQLVSTLSPPALQQMAVAEFMHNGSYDRHLNRLRNCFAEQVKSVSMAITEYFPADTGITRPQGGFVLWVELLKNIDSAELQKKAFAEHISINPGTLFSARDNYKNFIRISCGQPWSDKLKDAVIKLGRLTEQLIRAK